MGKKLVSLFVLMAGQCAIVSAAADHDAAELQKACDSGRAMACFDVASLHWRGAVTGWVNWDKAWAAFRQGVDVGKDQALALNQKACESGKPGACYNVGLMYANGWGVRLLHLTVTSSGFAPHVVSNLEIATGTGTIGTLDTTTLRKGTYWVHLQATNLQSQTQTSIALIGPARRSFDPHRAQLRQPDRRLRLWPDMTPMPNPIFQSYYKPQPGLYGKLESSSDTCNGVQMRYAGRAYTWSRAAGLIPATYSRTTETRAAISPRREPTTRTAACKLTDGDGRITQYAYNTGTRVTTKTNPDTGVEIVEQDERGNILRKRDALNRVTTYTVSRRCVR